MTPPPRLRFPRQAATMKSLPPPARGMHAMSPPWSRAILRAMVSPSPVPCTRLERESSTRKNSRKIRSRSFSATPIPRSRTCTDSRTRVSRSAPREPAWAVCEPRRRARHLHLDLLSVGRVLLRVREEVEDDLLQRLGIGTHRQCPPPSAARERRTRGSPGASAGSPRSLPRHAAASIALIAYLFPPRSLAPRNPARC